MFRIKTIKSDEGVFRFEYKGNWRNRPEIYSIKVLHKVENDRPYNRYDCMSKAGIERYNRYE